MSNDYARGLELLTQVQEQLSEIKSDAMNHRVTVQKWYALSQTWNALKKALIATGEAADKAVTANQRQRVLYRIHARTVMHAREFRAALSDSCVRHFQYVTALSHHAWTVAQKHASALRSHVNLQTHYAGASDLHADAIRPHQKFLDDLGRNLEAVKLRQRLETIYIRWVRLRAAADLRRQAETFHSTCRRLRVQKERRDRALKRMVELRVVATRCVEEYEDLETGVKDAQRAMQALGPKKDREGGVFIVSPSVQGQDHQ